jgi:hypothetical protein
MRRSSEVVGFVADCAGCRWGVVASYGENISAERRKAARHANMTGHTVNATVTTAVTYDGGKRVRTEPSK